MKRQGICVFLDWELYDQVKAVCASQERTLATVVRRALRHEVERVTTSERRGKSEQGYAQ